MEAHASCSVIGGPLVLVLGMCRYRQLGPWIRGSHSSTYYLNPSRSLLCISLKPPLCWNHSAFQHEVLTLRLGVDECKALPWMQKPSLYMLQSLMSSVECLNGQSGSFL